jgi:uncharacterized protein YndB with AHSA1/START domain
MATTEYATDTVQIRRTLAAPVEAVFRAWTTPEALSRWFRPTDEHTCTVHALDVRVGGAYRLELTHPRGARHVVGGVYRELSPPGLIAFTWRWEDNPTMGDTLVTVELRTQGSETELVLTHRMLTDEKLREDNQHGWNGCLDRLATTL